MFHEFTFVSTLVAFTAPASSFCLIWHFLLPRLSVVPSCVLTTVTFTEVVASTLLILITWKRSLTCIASFSRWFLAPTTTVICSLFRTGRIPHIHVFLFFLLPRLAKGILIIWVHFLFRRRSSSRRVILWWRSIGFVVSLSNIEIIAITRFFNIISKIVVCTSRIVLERSLSTKTIKGRHLFLLLPRNRKHGIHH